MEVPRSAIWGPASVMYYSRSTHGGPPEGRPLLAGEPADRPPVGGGYEEVQVPGARHLGARDEVGIESEGAQDCFGHLSGPLAEGWGEREGQGGGKVAEGGLGGDGPGDFGRSRDPGGLGEARHCGPDRLLQERPHLPPTA